MKERDEYARDKQHEITGYQEQTFPCKNGSFSDGKLNGWTRVCVSAARVRIIIIWASAVDAWEEPWQLNILSLTSSHQRRFTLT